VDSNGYCRKVMGLVFDFAALTFCERNDECTAIFNTGSFKYGFVCGTVNPRK